MVSCYVYYPEGQGSSATSLKIVKSSKNLPEYYKTIEGSAKMIRLGCYTNLQGIQSKVRRQIALPLSSIEALPSSNFKSTATLVMHEKENQWRKQKNTYIIKKKKFTNEAARYKLFFCPPYSVLLAKFTRILRNALYFAEPHTHFTSRATPVNS